jgi:hypothetical protein
MAFRLGERVLVKGRITSLFPGDQVSVEIDQGPIFLAPESAIVRPGEPIRAGDEARLWTGDICSVLWTDGKAALLQRARSPSTFLVTYEELTRSAPKTGEP